MDFISNIDSVYFIFSSLFILITSVWFFPEKTILKFFTFCLFFVSLGSISMTEVMKSDLALSFDKSYSLGESYKLNILEVNNQNKEWNKIIGRIEYIKLKEEIIACDEKVVLFIQTENDTLQVGDNLTLNSGLISIQNKGNPGEFDAKFYYKSKGINKIGFVSKKSYIKLNNSISFITKWSLKSRNYLGGILENHFDGQELALAQALILGDRSFLDPETTANFGNSGAMHVLAVSGLHIGIILQIILAVLKIFSKHLSRQKAFVIALTLIWIYTFISGLSASVLRSTFMFSVLAFSQLNGKNYNPLNSLFFTCFVLLLINPFFLLDIGFQLSFLAMVGIFWFYKPISKWIFIKNKWMRRVWEGTAVGIAAQFVTVPLTLFYFHQFPNYFILTNIGLMFSTGLILGLGMFVFSFYWVKLAGKLVVFLLSIILFLTLKFVSFIDDLPGSVASGFELHWIIVLISFLIIVSIHLFKKFKNIYLMALFVSSLTLVCFVVKKRFDNINLKEICFFNQSKSTFLIKNRNVIYCFYDGKKDQLEKVKFSINSYIKLFPGKVEYLSLVGFDWKINKKGLLIDVSHLKNGFEIQVNNEYYFLKNRNSTSSDRIRGKIICMPWIVNDSNDELSLKSKSLRFLI